jgi:hypothetical protein
MHSHMCAHTRTHMMSDLGVEDRQGRWWGFNRRLRPELGKFQGPVRRDWRDESVGAGAACLPDILNPKP